MNEWWEALTAFEKIFWYIAIPFSLILIIQLIMTFVGMGDGDTDVGVGSDLGDMDLDMDGDIDFDSMDMQTESDFSVSDMDPSFNFFTIRNFIAFFTLFGWGGIAAWTEGASRPWTIVIAVIAGLIAMTLNASLFYFMSKMQDQGGGLKIQNALGQIGDVYLPIKAEGGNVGKIQVAIQGSIREMQAITKDKFDLTTGSVVKVIGVVSNSILVVEKLNK
ncbi:MAG TPA: hypothetical protein P5514_07275 [Bacteroidales bacterium]|nr:hypothetical protein [Bacteroidales bacterium]HPE57036.1 hypothetical protein [Bacteroidales bacterium]HRX96730.1 hypothetical protein [Bacteroidales bacterium]